MYAHHHQQARKRTPARPKASAAAAAWIPPRGLRTVEAVRALQRLAGNAAVAEALKVQRCGGETHAGCPCAEETTPQGDLPIQRAKIDFRPLTWGDFKGRKPAKFPAETASGIHKLPKVKQAKKVEDKGTPCTPSKAKKPTTEFSVRISVDPTMFDNIKAYMSQEESGADRDLAKDLAGATTKAVTACNAGFDKQLKEFTAEAGKQCKEQVAPCKQAFASGSTSFELTIGSTKVTATSKKDCSSSLVTDCKTASQATFKPGKHTFTHPGGSAEAAGKAACSAGFKTEVTKIHKAEAGRLLHHEQVHFNVTNDIATKLQKKLRDTAATLDIEVFECGKAAALAEATRTFNALDAGTKLQEIVKEAQKDLKTQQSTYDTQTNHGLIQTEQDKWNAKFP
ncbi:MAG: hypothetical protein ACRDTG_31915 [Pseudonocardiaceae bacterium]